MSESLYTPEQAMEIERKLREQSGLHVNIDPQTGGYVVRDGELGKPREATAEEVQVIVGTMNTPGYTAPSTDK